MNGMSRITAEQVLEMICEGEMDVSRNIVVGNEERDSDYDDEVDLESENDGDLSDEILDELQNDTSSEEGE